MATPTPRADALRAMREARFEAAQRQVKQETAKSAAGAARPVSVAAAPVADVAQPEPVAVVKKSSAGKTAKKRAKKA